MYKPFKFLLLGFLVSIMHISLFAQLPNTSTADSSGNQVTSIDADLMNINSQTVTKKYIIAGITVTGNSYYDSSLLISVSGLSVGDQVTIPGADNISKAINKLWSQKSFSDIAIYYTKLEGNNLYIEIHVVERPRLTHMYFKGIPKGQADELKGKTGLVLGHTITDDSKINAISVIRKYYDEKGFRNNHIKIQQLRDSSYLSNNGAILNIYVDKGQKVKISDVYFTGNPEVSTDKLKKQMKGTKEMALMTLYPAKDTGVWGIKTQYPFAEYWKDRGPLRPSLTSKFLNPYFRPGKLFNSAKFDEKKYTEDKEKVISYYNKLGYRDASIIKDTTYFNSKGNLDIAIKVNEGHKYYFGNITWRGNTLYSDSILNEILGVKKGDVYNQEILNTKLGITMNPEIADVSGLYQNQGYLFFQANPVESVYKDTINFEIRLNEGPQATIKYVRIAGNDKTNEHVARRELYTLPGDKFSREYIIRSQRQLANLGFFDQEKINPGIEPNQEDGTVDINWGLGEKSADQLELSAGFGGGIGLTGTLGLTFSNFSTRNIFNKSAWSPLPTGDGQKLSLRYQSNGRAYRSYNVSFTEPWLGGKKRNGLTVSLVDTKYSNGYNYYTGRYDSKSDTTWFRTTGITLGYTKQLRWPDDNFSLGVQLGYTRYKLHNYYIDYYNLPDFRNGASNNLNVKFTLNRYTINNPIFPTGGSNFMLSAQLTPPYSLMDSKIANYTDSRKYRWIEYHKWRFTGEWYIPIGATHGEDHKQFVLKMSAKMGYIGKYNTNPKIEVSPFERFQVGNSGLSNTYSFLGYDIISQRGYPVYSSSNPSNNPDQQQATSYFTLFNKYTTELRYPLSLNPSSTIYGLAFFEAANGWYNFKSYNPFQLRRSVGLGMRFNLPMFGLLGFDYGIGLDRTQPGQGIKGAGSFTFMMGFEPD